MRRLAGSHAALIAVLATACARDDQSTPDTEGDAATAASQPPGDTTLPDVPASVRYDAELDIYYVANVKDHPSRRDNNGYVARVGADSAVGMTKLVEGGRDGVTLNAPRSIALRGDTLYVEDTDMVRMFNRHTGAPLGAVTLTSTAAFPNELRAGEDGMYITDMGVIRTADGSQGATPPGRNPLSDIIGAANAVMSGPMSAAARKHMELTPIRHPTRDDSAQARQVAEELRTALRKYADTSAAVADGYRKLMSNLKGQRVLHFTNYRNALAEAFRFEPSRPTSILYQRTADGGLKIIGAMYTAPRRSRAERLDDRIPLSIARWHQHVNWCLPSGSEGNRLTGRRDGLPLFGPDSPIATRRECEAVRGVFHPNLFGWMVHANVFLGDDLHTIFGDHH